VSKLDEIRARKREGDSLAGFPCEWLREKSVCTFGPECGEWDCKAMHVYSDYLLLLEAVEVSLGGTTPKQNVLICAVSIGLETDDDVKAALRRERNAWEKLI